jgi:hypothetical protein
MDEEQRRDEIFTMVGALGVYWLRHPDLRLGQVIGNFATMTQQDAYYMEDAEILRRLRGEGAW